MLITPFTMLFGVVHPIVCGGKNAVGTAGLVAEVANAGALGFLTTSSQPTPEGLAREIARCREVTDKPFGVNLALAPVVRQILYPAYRDVIIDLGVLVVEVVGDIPAVHLTAFHAAGVTVLHRVATLGHAIAAQDLGADAVAIEGAEWAEDRGEEDVGGLLLIPAVANRLNVPIVASTGLADGRALAAALALGASAINVSARFIDDVASCGELITRIVGEAEDIITGRLARLVRLPGLVPNSLRAEPASETKLETALEAAWDFAP